jgi:hypothetical protein
MMRHDASYCFTLRYVASTCCMLLYVASSCFPFLVEFWFKKTHACDPSPEFNNIIIPLIVNRF